MWYYCRRSIDVERRCKSDGGGRSRARCAEPGDAADWREWRKGAVNFHDDLT